MPIAVNNFTFELRENCRQIFDRKWHSINAIQCQLRSKILDVLTRSNVKLFTAIGIISPFQQQINVERGPVTKKKRE